MASPAAQAKAQALNAKLEGQARMTIDEMEKTLLRKVARKAYACCTSCYDKAGTTGPTDQLEQCVRQCQVPHNQANQLIQGEISHFQNRLNRSMQDCQDKARDLMKPGYENDAKQSAKVEEALISCMAKTVDQHIALLKPLQSKVASQLKQL